MFATLELVENNASPTTEQKNRPKGDGSLYQKKDTGVWMYSVMQAGKRLTKSLKTRDEDEAQKEYQTVRNNFLGRIDRGELEPPTVTNCTLQELLDDYIKHLSDNRKPSAVVFRSVADKIGRAKEFGDGEKATRKVATLTTHDFKAYRTRLVEREQTSTHSTVNHHLSLIRAALKLESKQTPSRVGKVPHIPMVNADTVREGFLEYDDHKSILEALPESSFKALFVVAFHSGCRLGEVLNMRWADVDWANRVVRLPKTKNGRQRNLPFWGSVESRLKNQKTYRDRHHPECGHLFFWMEADTKLSHGGVRMLPGTPIKDFRGSWSTAVKDAHKANPNVKPDLLFHDLRRSAVRVMVQETGIPEAQAMLISGHVTRSMLERYNIVSLKNVQDAGAKLDAWSKSRKSARKTSRSRVVAIGSKRTATA